MQENSAVFITNCYKSYGSKPVLENLCMRVDRGTIYGLLGASGCGKTTLLSAIVGRKKIDEGDIWVLGGKPGTRGSGVPGPRVGYMPQDIALVREFTVKDAIYYFGTILRMDRKLLEERFQYIHKLLDLPPADRFLKNCSGGQQRRVSFAAAMIHMPELLILDEPTVGIDPVLREKIWDYLVEITHKENLAVIITTHYIDECRQADKIGLMRGGRLLAEESPANLLRQFQTDSLEEVFLILSRKQEQGEITDNNGMNAGSVANSINSISTVDTNHASTDALATRKSKKKRNRKADKTLKEYFTPDLNSLRMKALLTKNWMQFYRNVTGVVFLLLFPIIQTSVFITSVGGNIKDIPLAIVNEEMPNGCADFNYNQSAILDGYDCYYKQLSCRYLMILDDPMLTIHYEKEVNEAIEKIRKGQFVGVMHISKNFTDSLKARLDDGRGVDNASLDASEIKMYMDMSNRQIGETVKGKLIRLYLDFQEQVLKDCDYSPKAGRPPLNFDEYVYGDIDDPYTEFMAPGILITLIFFMGSMMTSTIIITDRCEGVWDRSIVAGVTALEITLTHFALQVCVAFIQSWEVVLCCFYVWGMTYAGNIFSIWFLVFASAVTGMAYGFWVSAISENHSMANTISTGTFVPLILLSGMIWPMQAMPKIVYYISKCTPFSIPIDGLRNLIHRGWSITDFEVLDGLGVDIIWSVFLICLSTYLVKKQR